MRIFITGGTGFIGRYLLEKLYKKNHQLLILTRNPKQLNNYKKTEILKGDLSDIDKISESVKKFNPEVAIHLAWEGIPDLGIENSIKNLIQGLNLVQLISKTECKKILISGSVWEYGNNKGKISESKATRPFNPFTISKDTLHTLGRELAEKHGINFIWARIFYVYGPGQKKSSLIPHLIDTLKEGINPEIRNPYAKNDFIFVDDVANALVLIVEKNKNSKIYNIGSGKQTSVKRIIEILFKNFKITQTYKKAKPKQIDSVKDFYADITNLEQLGWQPKITITEGIKKMIEDPLAK